MVDVENGAENPQKWFVLALAATGTFMGMLDITIVNVALPTLTKAFDTRIAISQWYMLGYALAITILLLPAGKASDIFGRRCIYGLGVVVFTAGSIFSGLAISSGFLIVARLIQGVGTAMLTAAGPALVTEAFGHSGRGKALGFIGVGTALGMLLGPLVGGLLVHYANWRWIFFVNVPIGITLACLLKWHVIDLNEAREGKIDVPGAVLMGIALTALLLAMTYGQTLGWLSAPIDGAIVLAIVLGVWFIVRELRSAEPVLDLRLFHDRVFSTQNIAGFANYAAMIPSAVFMPFYLQDVLHYGANVTGFVLASSPFTLAVVAPISGAYSDKVGAWGLVLVGLIITGVGSFLMYGLTADSGWFAVVWRIILLSVGSGLLVSPNSSAALSAAGEENLGMASAILALVRNSGMVLGIALAAAIISTAMRGHSLTQALEAGGYQSGTDLLQGLKEAFLAGAGIAFIGAIAFFIGSGPEKMSFAFNLIRKRLLYNRG